MGGALGGETIQSEYVCPRSFSAEHGHTYPGMEHAERLAASSQTQSSSASESTLAATTTSTLTRFARVATFSHGSIAIDRRGSLEIMFSANLPCRAYAMVEPRRGRPIEALPTQSEADYIQSECLGSAFPAEAMQRLVTDVGALRAGESFVTILIEAQMSNGPAPRALLRAAIDVTMDGSDDVRPIAPPRESVQMDSAVIEVQELFGVASSAVGAATPATPAAECTVCMTERCSTALLPCGHVCVCAECGETLRQRRDPCPVCRAPVATFMLLLTTT